MGCEFSRLFVWWSKPGRKRLSSGDSDFRQDSDEKLQKADDQSEATSARKQNRLRKMFTRSKKSKQTSTENPNPKFVQKLPAKSANDFSSVHSEAETAVRNRNVEQVMTQGGDGFNFHLLSISGGCRCHTFNPVELACSLGYFDMVQMFLDNGCSPNLPTAAGKLLHTVLESIKSHKESLEAGRNLVRHLICLGCDLDIKNRCGVTPLMYCAQIGDHNLVQMVLEKCSERQLTWQCSGSLYTPLHMSAMKGDFECVKLLLARCPHKHVNVVDKAGNTALHLALKSMLHNIPYLNEAKVDLLLSSDQGRQKAAACQRLMSFQQNAVAIVEALVMAGAEVNASCNQRNNSDHWTSQDTYPLIYALQLCDRDETLGFELDPSHFSTTLNLVSTQTIQSLEDLSKRERCNSQERPTDDEENKRRFSPYAGVVRLLALAGTEIAEPMRKNLYHKFNMPLHFLLVELCAFWERYEVSRPPKLVHLSKLVIRAHMASVHKLHQINSLPLPPRMKEYLKLNFL